MRAAGREPLERYPGRRAPWRSCCIRCGIERCPTLGNVLSVPDRVWRGTSPKGRPTGGYLGDRLAGAFAQVKEK